MNNGGFGRQGSGFYQGGGGVNRFQQQSNRPGGMWQNPPQPFQQRQQQNNAQQQNNNPQQQNNTPQQQNNTPQQQNNTPQQQNKTPQQQNKTPQQQNKTPQQQNNTPQLLNNTPKQLNNPPKQLNNPPKQQNNTPQQQNNNLQQQINNAQNQRNNSPAPNKGTNLQARLGPARTPITAPSKNETSNPSRPVLMRPGQEKTLPVKETKSASPAIEKKPDAKPANAAGTVVAPAKNVPAMKAPVAAPKSANSSIIPSLMSSVVQPPTTTMAGNRFNNKPGIRPADQPAAESPSRKPIVLAMPQATDNPYKKNQAGPNNNMSAPNNRNMNNQQGPAVSQGPNQNRFNQSEQVNANKFGGESNAAQQNPVNNGPMAQRLGPQPGTGEPTAPQEKHTPYVNNSRFEQQDGKGNKPIIPANAGGRMKHENFNNNQISDDAQANNNRFGGPGNANAQNNSNQGSGPNHYRGGNNKFNARDRSFDRSKSARQGGGGSASASSDVGGGRYGGGNRGDYGGNNRRDGGGGRGRRDYAQDKLWERLHEISGPQLELEPLDLSEKKFNAHSRLFVGSLPRDIMLEELKEMFSKHGELGQVYFNKEGSYAFINFDFRTNAEKAMHELNATQCKGRALKVRFAAITTGVRVKNLGHSVTNELLSLAFSVFGDVETSRVVVDDRGKPTGDGSVIFSEKKSAVMAYKKCQEESYFITSQLRPVIVEPWETRDDEEGYPEAGVQKNEHFKKDRKTGPRFAEPNTFESDYGKRWKQLFDIYKEKRLSLESDLKAEMEALEVKMQLVVHQQETDKLRQELAQREQEAVELQMGLGAYSEQARPTQLSTGEDFGLYGGPAGPNPGMKRPHDYYESGAAIDPYQLSRGAPPMTSQQQYMQQQQQQQQYENQNYNPAQQQQQQQQQPGRTGGWYDESYQGERDQRAGYETSGRQGGNAYDRLEDRGGVPPATAAPYGGASAAVDNAGPPAAVAADARNNSAPGGGMERGGDRSYASVVSGTSGAAYERPNSRATSDSADRLKNAGNNAGVVANNNVEIPAPSGGANNAPVNTNNPYTDQHMGGFEPKQQMQQQFQANDAYDTYETSNNSPYEAAQKRGRY